MEQLLAGLGLDLTAHALASVPTSCAKCRRQRLTCVTVGCSSSHLLAAFCWMRSALRILLLVAVHATSGRAEHCERTGSSYQAAFEFGPHAAISAAASPGDCVSSPGWKWPENTT
eukprot:1479597-Rhodomonas_salina.3